MKSLVLLNRKRVRLGGFQPPRSQYTQPTYPASLVGPDTVNKLILALRGVEREIHHPSRGIDRKTAAHG